MNIKVLKRAIQVSWCLLVAYFVLKVLGGTWLSLNCTDTFFENNLWLYAIICSITSYVLFNLYYLAICGELHFNKWIHLALIPYFVGVTLLKLFVIPVRFCILLDIVSNFIVPAILIYITYKPKKTELNKYYVIISAFVMNCGFQLISTMIRDVAVTVVVTNLMAQLIMTIDVFIMLALYWLYSVKHKKEVKGMSFVFTLLLGKGKEELTAMLSEVNAKLAVNPEDKQLQAEKAVIESKLEELK